MTATSTQTAPATSAGAVPAGLNEPQLLALKRVEAARAAVAALPKPDPEYLAAERSWEQWRRWNGADQ